MKFTIATVAGAMAGLAAAEVAFTNTNYNMAAGTPFTLTWSGASGDGVTILLKSGESGNLKTVETLDSGEKASSFVWTPPSSLCSEEVYAFEVVDGSDTNYSPQFSITGLSACAATTGSTSTTSSTSTRSTTVSQAKTSSDSSSAGNVNNAVSSTSSTSSSASSRASPATLVSNSTVTGSGSSSTLSTARSTTSTPGATESPIINANNAQRASYSQFAILLVVVAGLLCLN